MMGLSVIKNKDTVGKYIIVKDLVFSDYMKDEHDNIKLFNSLDEACETCGMYEFENVLVCEVKFNHVER